MALERDIQEYLTSGEVLQINIGSTSYNNQVVTRGELPQNYITDSDLVAKALSGEYSAIYIGGTVEGNKVATKAYVDEAVITGGGYTDAEVLNVLSSGEVSVIYIGDNTNPDNEVATVGYVNTSPVNYGDNDVQTLLSAGTVTEIYVNEGSGKVKVATLDDLVTAQTALPRLAEIVEVTTSTLIITTAHSGKNIHFNSVTDHTVTVDSDVLPVGMQIALFNMTSFDVDIVMSSGTVNGGVSLLDQIPQYSGLYMTHWKQGEWVAG